MTVRTIQFMLFGAAMLLATACQSTGTPAATVAPEIRVEPDIEHNLYSFCRVVLQDVSVSQGVFTQQSPTSGTDVPCIVVSGHIRNMDMENSTITMFAYGYDAAGERVAETLDADDIHGQLTLHVEYGETSPFTLHVSTCDTIQAIRIFAHTHGGTLS